MTVPARDARFGAELRPPADPETDAHLCPSAPVIRVIEGASQYAGSERSKLRTVAPSPRSSQLGHATTTSKTLLPYASPSGRSDAADRHRRLEKEPSGCSRFFQITALFTAGIGILFVVSYFGHQGLDDRYGQTSDHPRKLSYLEKGGYEKAKGAWAMSRVMFPALVVILITELIVYGAMSWIG